MDPDSMGEFFHNLQPYLRENPSVHHSEIQAEQLGSNAVTP